jgi:hypothetical protein
LLPIFLRREALALLFLRVLISFPFLVDHRPRPSQQAFTCSFATKGSIPRQPIRPPALRQAVVSLRVLVSPSAFVCGRKRHDRKDSRHGRHRSRPFFLRDTSGKRATTRDGKRSQSRVPVTHSRVPRRKRTVQRSVGTQFFPGPTEALCHSPQHAPSPLFQAPITAQFCQLEPPGPSGNNRLVFATLTKSHRGSTIHGLQRAR